MPAIAVENIRKMKIMKFSAKKLTQNFDPSSLSKKIRKCVHSSLNVFNQTVFKHCYLFRLGKMQDLRVPNFSRSPAKRSWAQFQFTWAPCPGALVSGFNVC